MFTGVAIGVVALVLVGLGGPFVLGAGQPGDSSAAPATGTTPGDDGSSNGSTPGPDHVRPFTLDVRSIEECGRTCRDVTISLTNNGGNPRDGITVATTMYADEDVVWEGEEPIGALGSRESATRTVRVDVGLVGGAKIERNGGTVTIETVVRWDGGSATFRTERRVA